MKSLLLDDSHGWINVLIVCLKHFRRSWWYRYTCNVQQVQWDIPDWLRVCTSL